MRAKIRQHETRKKHHSAPRGQRKSKKKKKKKSTNKKLEYPKIRETHGGICQRIAFAETPQHKYFHTIFGI